MNKIVVILPTYNEKGNVEPMTTQILQQNDGIDVLIIDDNSPDGTGEIAKKLSESNPRVKFISRPGKLGLGSAYYKGFRYGYDNGYDYIFSIDSDFSHDPKYLPEMIAAMDNGADLTVGSRYVPGGGTKNWPLHRRLLSKFANIYVKTFTRGVVNDNTAGYVGIKREVIPNISLERIKCEGYAYQIELKYRIAKKKYKVHEVPIVFVERVYGQSKISKNIIFEAFLTVIRIGLFGVKY